MKELILKILKEEVLIKESTIDHFGKTYNYKVINLSRHNSANWVWFNGLTEVEDNKHFDTGTDGFEPEIIPLTKLKGSAGEFILDSRDLYSNSAGDALKVSATKLTKKYPEFKKRFSGIDTSEIAIKIKSDDSKKYQKKVRDILQRIYSRLKDKDGNPLYGVSDSSANCETNQGVINYKGISYGKNNELISNWSILNYFDTNSEVIKYIFEMFLNSDKGKNFEEVTDLNFGTVLNSFVSWIEENANMIFSPESRIIDELESLNLTTIKIGIENEQRAIPVLIKIHNITEDGLTQYCPGSKQDTLFGRDFKVNDDNLYYQIKPLKSTMFQQNGRYNIRTSNFKKYGKTVDRFMFISNKKYYVFENKNYDINKYKDLVSFAEPPIESGDI